MPFRRAGAIRTPRMGGRNLVGARMARRIIQIAAGPVRPIVTFDITLAATFGSNSMPGWVAARNWGKADPANPSFSGIGVNGVIRIGSAVRLSMDAGTPVASMPSRIEVGTLEAARNDATYAGRGLGAQCDYAVTSGSIVQTFRLAQTREVRLYA